MAIIRGSEGIIMNSSNTSNAYMRWYSRGKNDSGPFIRFTIAAGNPYIHVMVKAYWSMTQTNANDFHSSEQIWTSFYCDTNGNCANTLNGFWISGANNGYGYNFATRQANLYLSASSNGGFPAKISALFEIYCNRWDYVTVSNVDS